MLHGRNLSVMEAQSAASVCIVGYDVAAKLFGDEVSLAVNKEVRINNQPHRVIAVLKSRGSTFGFSRDNVAIIGYKNLLRSQ